MQKISNEWPPPLIVHEKVAIWPELRLLGAVNDVTDGVSAAAGSAVAANRKIKTDNRNFFIDIEYEILCKR